MLVAFVIFISLRLYSVGITVIWAALVAWTPWLVMVAVALILGIAFCYGVCQTISRQFGKEFVSFYHKNLCPRIKVPVNYEIRKYIQR